MDSEAESVIGPHLVGDERLLWAGRPPVGAFLRIKDAGGFVFQLVWCILIVAGAFALYRQGVAGAAEGFVAVLVLSLFLCYGLSGLIRGPRDRRELTRALRYGFSSRRLYFGIPRPEGVFTQAIELSRVETIRRFQGLKRGVTIIEFDCGKDTDPFLRPDIPYELYDWGPCFILGEEAESVFCQLEGLRALARQDADFEGKTNERAADISRER